MDPAVFKDSSQLVSFLLACSYLCHICQYTAQSQEIGGYAHKLAAIMRAAHAASTCLLCIWNAPLHWLRCDALIGGLPAEGKFCGNSACRHRQAKACLLLCHPLQCFKSASILISDETTMILSIQYLHRLWYQSFESESHLMTYWIWDQVCEHAGAHLDRGGLSPRWCQLVCPEFHTAHNKQEGGNGWISGIAWWALPAVQQFFTAS